MRKITLLLTLFLYGISFCQEKNFEPSASFINQINSINSKILNIQELLAENKLQEANKLIEKLPIEIEGFKFLYKADATEIYERNIIEIKTLNKNLSDLKKELLTLKDENKVLKSNANKEIVVFLEKFLAKKDSSDKKITELESENEKLNNERLELTEIKTSAIGETLRLADSIKVLKNTNLDLENQLKSIYTSVKFGLSIGFNGFIKNELDYVIRADSTVRETGNSSGISGLISAVIAIRLDPENKNNLLVNIPLGDFTSDPTQAIGIFNSRIAVGLGYARSISKDSPNLLIGASFNISPYEQIDFSEIKDRKFELQEFTRLNPENYGSTTSYSYSFTVGIVYTFNTSKK
jgi:hypothetical protein